ncbi:Endopolyphosphatase [Delitschia confertaspora ATCC 74209]|uniref:Endopolyphosphatase n=1 Tax=Delitschia confertaspora ATCC 74209 TaxID=1513339 RepID=A0A9P4MRG6_9PLEO|nr:Endopolyphosphatase [Delitschia confertaspora ATCC 74209]
MPSVQQALLWGICSLCLTCGASPSLVTDPPATSPPNTQSGRKLHGRFLQITDIHPDPFYKTWSSTEADAACHRKKGPAGVYGAETSGCDTPISLVNETFKWIEANLKDKIDFVVWTGDSARHDNDEKIPRTPTQIIEQNEFVVSKFTEVFGRDGTRIPIVPTFGNNDIMPHNIFLSGPNKWTLKYTDIWRHFIPEEQRHQFQRGGWFYVEVIPRQLAVISMNTIYFFDSNSAVNGCGAKDEPGYEHMEWLRIQLEQLRRRGMKAILMGHVPPARTESKLSWDETCWQKFTLWQRQYRDILVTSLFGHMNLDHFMLHDFRELKRDTKRGRMKANMAVTPNKRVSMFEDGEVTITSASDYLLDLRESWAKLPSLRDALEAPRSKREGKSGKAPHKKMHEIGGQWGERFSVGHVSPSVIPTYFPTLRVFEYNITGLEDLVIPAEADLLSPTAPVQTEKEESDQFENPTLSSQKDKRKKAKKPHKKRKKYKFKVPSPPSKSTPPGPAYSPQTLTLTGYVQYFANITRINNDFVEPNDSSLFNGQKWNEGKHKGKQPKHNKPRPKEFEYEIEYNTTCDKVYRLKDLTVKSYLELATRIGDQDGKALLLTEEEGITYEDEIEFDVDRTPDDLAGMEKNGEKKNKKKHRKRPHKGKHDKNSVWYTFVKRAFVGTMDADDIAEQFSIAEYLEEITEQSPDNGYVGESEGAQEVIEL